jgi:hypothetical protein
MQQGADNLGFSFKKILPQSRRERREDFPLSNLIHYIEKSDD